MTSLTFSVSDVTPLDITGPRNLSGFEPLDAGRVVARPAGGT